MFSEAYIIFSLGLIKPLQAAMFPSCFTTHQECSQDMVHLQNYLQICGIIVGMLVFGTLADTLSRQRGSRLTSSIMVSGAVLLVFAPFLQNARAFLDLFIFAQAW